MRMPTVPKLHSLVRRSIRYRLLMFIIVPMVATLLLCLVASKTMLDQYFVYTERRSIEKQYLEIRNQFEKEDAIDTLYLESVAGRNNLKIMVVKRKDGRYGTNSMSIVYSSAGKGGHMYLAMYELLQNLNSSSILQSEVDQLYKNLREQGFVVLDHREDSLDFTSIDLLGYLGDEYLIIMDSSVESLEKAAMIATRFLAIAGGFVTCFTCLMAFFYSKRFTGPIEEMSEIANRMTELDFDARVTNLTEDELGQLGNSMNRLSAQLEETITELKNANVELLKDNEEKTQIDEMRKEFLSHVSHELKTPIALIQGYAEGLIDNVTEDEESRAFYCEVIMDEARKMNQMVQKLMKLNELESGHNQMDIKRFCLSEMLSNVVSANRIRFEEKDVKLLTECPEHIFAWGDEFYVEDVVSNYISNAYNHVVTGGSVRVYVELFDQRIRTWVFNEGPQIPEEELEKIWIKFYKVDKARTREYGGSGVGLSIVSAIMQAHHMEYGVKNMEDGVAFYFDLEKA